MIANFKEAGTTLSALRSCAVLREWPNDALCELAELTQLTRYKRGMLLHRRGDTQSRLYVVVEGALEFGRSLYDGRTYVLPYLPPGEPFGLAAILADTPALFDVRTRAESVLISIPREVLRAFLSRHPELWPSIVSAISQRYCRLYEQLEVVSTLPLRQRLARVLMQLVDTFGVYDQSGTWLSIRVSQADLADLTAASRQRVNVEFRSFAADGILAARHGRITVHDVGRLRAQGGRVSGEVR